MTDKYHMDTRNSYAYRIGMFSFFFLFPFLLHAQTLEIREFYNSIRSQGMGGASIAVTNDETSLLSNPAGLGKLRDSFGTLIDPELEASARAQQFYGKDPFSQPTSLKDVAPAVVKWPDKYFHSKQQLFPSYVVRNFGIGILSKKTLDLYNDPATSKLQTFYQDDLALVLGYNFRFWDGRIKIGFNGKIVNRIEFIDSAVDPTGDLSMSGNASEGTGFGYDAGLILSAPWATLPTLSILAHDIGGMKFNAASGLRMTSLTQPADVLGDYDAAIAFFPIHGSKQRSTLTFEYQKIKEAATYTDKSKFYHIGYEFNLADLLFFRMGMNQKYWTAGAEFASEHIQMQISSYGEDIGLDGASKEDRRVAVKFSFRY